MSQDEVVEIQEKISKLSPELRKNILKYIDSLLEEKLGADTTQTHFASEQVLAKDWQNQEEDKAWEGL